MAAVMESFVSNYLLNKLVGFAEDKVAMIDGVKDELKKLERRMRHVGAFLKDAKRRRITEESVNNWLNELKDVMYDADDIIDLWRYNNQSSPPEKPTSSSISPTCCSFSLFSCFRSIPLRHDVATQIKSLNARLEEIFNNMASLNLQQISSEVQLVDSLNTNASSPIIDINVVGNKIEESANNLVKIAERSANKFMKMVDMDNKQKFDLVAITGMGGIGKTTLAQKIYNNTILQNRYTERMWLSVSQSNSRTQLIKAAIGVVGGNPGNAEMESQLLPILANAISGKSFFLVLDDVWDSDKKVDSLLNALKSSATYGFILVTTRDQRVAMRMGATYIHQKELLDPKSGWELLCKTANVTDVDDIKNLQDVGSKIVENCGGLPLAIKAVAGMLATKNKNKNDWENVLKNSVWSINGLPEEINQALYLSYEDLSPQLKQCFIFCSLHPPNRTMFRVDLIKLWLAAGLIEERGNQDLENIAEDCYLELIKRHLLEITPLLVDQSQCRMHDLLRSLGQYLSKEESLFANQLLPHPALISRLRHLSIAETNERISIPGPPTEPLRLRTFRIFKCISQIENHTFARLRHLRVLMINEKGLDSIPESLGEMIHLRLLDLDRTSISSLPESIGSLTNLLFLNLQGCHLLHKLPTCITRLCNLRLLNVRNTPLTFVPRGIGGLRKLTQICGFQVVDYGSHNEYQDGWDLRELEGLSQLRRIEISKLERARNGSVVFANKSNLKDLLLEFSEAVKSSDHMEELEDQSSWEILEELYPPTCIEKLVIKNYGGKMLPRWMTSSSVDNLLPNLQSLHLTRWSCCTDLPPLGSLPNLKYLKIIGASAIVRISAEFFGIKGRMNSNFLTAFPKLEYLIFEDMPNWEEWVLSDFEGKNSSHLLLMPRVKQLSIEKCPKLRALPKGFKNLTIIRDLFLRATSNMKSIQDFQFECEVLDLVYNERMEILSNLPGVKKLWVRHSHNLRHVSKLDSLVQIELRDYQSKEGLPMWLVTLMNERIESSKDKLHLDLWCSKTLLERCLKDGPNWPIIKCFSSVRAYTEDKSAFMEYTRDPESYFASL